ncbi:MAG: VWA domain-containing protein [Deltaproteobacteria bacterium]|nr:VWA domain-containing protein [Deltaproteobacteria bacterium]
MRCLRCAGACALWLAACDPRFPEPPNVDQQRVIDVHFVVPETKVVDVLLVIDRSGALLPSADFIDQQLEYAGLALDGLPSPVSARIGVVTGDPTDEGALVGGGFLTVRRTETALHTNVLGSTGDALRTLANVRAVGSSANQALAAVDQALAHDELTRDGSRLAVIIVAGKDDSSAVDPGELGRRLDARVASLFVAGGGDRLHTFASAFASPSAVHEIVPLESLDPAYAIDAADPPPLNIRIANPCFDGPPWDSDRETPGLQPDCVVTQSGRSIARCDDAIMPCWSLATTDVCPLYGGIVVHQGDVDVPPNTLVELQCVAE